jgi:cardiolipin synthase A/B
MNMGHVSSWRHHFRAFLSWARWLVVLALVSFTLSSAALPAQATDPPETPDEHLIYLPLLQRPPPRIVIAAAHIDSALTGEPDEALLLWNLDSTAHSLAGWQLKANGRAALVPVTSTLTIEAGGRIWCAREAVAFRHTFGFSPDCEWGQSDPEVPSLFGSTPQLTNNRGTVQLIYADGGIADTFLYGAETATSPGWNGPATQLYSRGSIPAQGQVMRRKFDPVSGLPVDSDRSSDWSSDLVDLAWGRQVFFPGWRVWFGTPLILPPSPVVQATTSVAIGPDALFAPIAERFANARHTIDLSLYTFEHPEMALLLADAVRRGVVVRLLLEGAPAGGISNLQRWCLAQMAEAGVTIFYMAAREDAPKGYRPRYRYTHAKYGIVDEGHILIGTENFARDAMPPSTEMGRPRGRRGAYLFTDAPPAVEQLRQIFDADWAPERFFDLRPFSPGADGPPPDFVPVPYEPGILYEAPFAQPFAVNAGARFATLSVPENATRPDSTLMALLAQARPGDLIHWVQLYEHKFWGETSSNPIADPNPRLQALIEAARRGASLRILLDSHFDSRSDRRGNHAVADYLHTLAAAESLDIEARVGNPAGLGLHAKVLLLRIGDEHWSGIGSINGGEVSHKLNREVMLMVENAAIYGYLVSVFEHDWEVSNE